MSRAAFVTEQLVTELRKNRATVPVSQIPRALVVEDNPNDAELVLRPLRTMGYLVTRALTGEQALEELNKNNFDIVFLDLKLPGISGIGVLRRIKDNPKLRGLPVIIITGSATTQMLHDAAALGYVGLIEKPLLEADVDEISQKHKIDL